MAATPRYWETYARIRWSIPLAARSRAVVLGGFIGAAEDGRTTTLGRGGSDLTATIVGAAINAEEVQVWKDVDGMLTWDPKIKAGGYRLKSLSYEEARDLAQAGATTLHPETMAPAQRLRIPVVIRNTFRPDSEGTRIGLSKVVCSNPVKSIACKSNVSVIELRSPVSDGTISEYSPVVERICEERKTVTLLGMAEDVIYLGVDQNSSDLGLNLAPGKCLKVYLRTGQSIITLVGQGLKTCTVAARLSGLLKHESVLLLPQAKDSCSRRRSMPSIEPSSAMWIRFSLFQPNSQPRTGACRRTYARLFRESGRYSNCALPGVRYARLSFSPRIHSYSRTRCGTCLSDRISPPAAGNQKAAHISIEFRAEPA